MRNQLTALATLALAAVAGCGGADQGAGTGEGAFSSQSAVLAFGADWRIEQTGSLVEGGSVRVEYDAERLSACRGDDAVGRIPRIRRAETRALDRYCGGDGQDPHGGVSFDLAEEGVYWRREL